VSAPDLGDECEPLSPAELPPPLVVRMGVHLSFIARTQAVCSRREIFGGVTIAPCGAGEQWIPRGIGQCYNSLRGSGKEELIKRALVGASAAAVIALAPFCIPPAQAHADNPCASITDPAAQQACVGESLRDDPMHRYQMGDCQGSPDYGAEGQFCRNFWVRKSAPPASRQLSEL